MKITSTLNGVTLASRDEITEHTENSTIHITAAERTEWNAKADASDITWEHVFVAGGVTNSDFTCRKQFDSH